MEDTLTIIVTHRGDFYKAEHEGKRVCRDCVMKLLEADENSGFRLEYYIDKYVGKYTINTYELNTD